jgi:hypothetical protein
MTPVRQRPLLERLLLACVALLFLLQPTVGAAGSCSLRAKLFGSPCCCAPTPKKSCCSKRAEHNVPAPKRCKCELNAPPLLPPAGPSELPTFLGELARALELPLELPRPLTLAELLPRAHAPPGFASCFHAHLSAGMARALAFERTLRC